MGPSERKVIAGKQQGGCVYLADALSYFGYRHVPKVGRRGRGTVHNQSLQKSLPVLSFVLLAFKLGVIVLQLLGIKGTQRNGPVYLGDFVLLILPVTCAFGYYFVACAPLRRLDLEIPCT